MLSIDKLRVQFADRILFEDVSFMANAKDRIGLVGKNGAGKSTLLKIIAGHTGPDKGRVVLNDGAVIGYLPQHMDYDDDTSILEEAKKAFIEIRALQGEIKEVEEEMGRRTDYDSEAYHTLIERLTDLHNKLGLFDEGTVDQRVEQCLIGLGFDRQRFSEPTSSLSGGWRMRVELAKILLRQPTILLLDEPTNHLDIESIQWLEKFLSQFEGVLVLISHDRAFLDQVTNRTVEITLGKIHDYNTNYTKYVAQRKERMAHQIAAYENQRKMIEETERFIERFKAKATKAVQVQSRIKQLEKIERIEIEEEDHSVMNLRFPEAPRSGNVTVELDELSKKYDDHLVLDQINLVIERGEKVAFVGRNGEGKTTLSRIIMSELAHDGNCKIGHNVKIGYFAQNQDKIMDGKLTVFETLDHIAVGDIRTKLRDILGAFLFRGEDIDKKVSVLSGGERSRLAMAKLLLQPYNLLVLDEPTNHLDMRSKDILKLALKEFKGTVIIVSHDREFLDGLIDKVYEFRNKKVKEHLGGIYDFLRKKNLETLNELEFKSKTQKTVVSKPINNDYAERKEHEKRLRKQEKKVSNLEELIEQKEGEIVSMNEKLADSEFIVSKDGQEMLNLYRKVQDELEAAMKQWEQAEQDLQKIQNEQKD